MLCYLKTFQEKNNCLTVGFDVLFKEVTVVVSVVVVVVTLVAGTRVVTVVVVMLVVVGTIVVIVVEEELTSVVGFRVLETVGVVCVTLKSNYVTDINNTHY